ncbi:hypothetical protein JHD47_07250 [Sulfurimonas sp. SAG-AH-194-L11]|nr:hypothetical protein [Sulfurimonas sp. SAG-AH-194-L11]MDF1877613.1 hypothetical protein [Sulfurimonas sp. SAG-AH-194-L11]
MDVILKELLSRKSEIDKALELLFKANMKITDWDVPEADDQQAAEVLLEMMQDKLNAISADVKAGKYTNY